MWCSILTDPTLANLDNFGFAQWVKIGAYIAQHGESGTIEIEPPAKQICATLQVPDFGGLCASLDMLPNITRGVGKRNDSISVTLNRWHKYQVEESSTYRVKKWREKNQKKGVNVTKQRRVEEKRVEEIRKDLSPTSSNPPLNFFEKLKTNPAYSGIDIEDQFHKMKAWCDVNRKSPTERRFVNWLNRADKPIKEEYSQI